ncbi:CDP-alcohol phosphatidyltransferase family protein [Halobellus captivus]|uniref:CDP-alcohol phosphatidyltransferase family protein n=1 Tax=Halobellus captivus TaxID=2592614 RepID=UPI001EF1301C|nr:CDP-alcohol phosphatidyltransferase family protein [Halobellus captivus]
MTDEPTASTALRREWAAVATSVSLLLVGGAALLAILADASTLESGPAPILRTDPLSEIAIRWLLPALSVGAFELWFCFRYLGANRPLSEPAGGTYRTLGVPNHVTLVRGVLFAALAGFAALAPRPEIAWIPAALYGAGCALDAVDGFLARRLDRRTVLGAKLDMAFDTTGFLVAPVVAVLWGHLPIWYLSLSAARYLFRFGRGVRRRRGKPVYDLPDSLVRRPLAGVQMGFITLALAPLLGPGVLRVLAAVVLAPSLAVFLRDYLVVAGWYAPSEST